MIKTILLPLDGSPLAARVMVQLDPLLRAAQGLKLLVVVDTARAPAKADADLRARIRAAKAELTRYEEQLAQAGCKASGEVLVGDPAALILTQASVNEPSLVAMATHGLGGLGRWTRGSVAERVLRRCAVPLLLVNASDVETALPFRRIVVPVDGSDHAASILPLVSEFARVHASEVVLLRIRLVGGAPAALGNPGWTFPVAEADDELVQAGIEKLRERLEQQGVSARCVVGEDANAAQGILDALAAEKADLVALTTHGRTGLDRFLFGSVAEKVVHRCAIPLMIHRVAGRVPAAAGDA